MKIELGISLNKPTNHSKSVLKKPSWSKVLPSDILKYSTEKVNWDYTSDDISSEMMWNELREKLDGFSGIVPVSRFDSRNRPLNLPWSNSALKRMRKNKDAAWNCFIESPTKENYSYAFTKEKLYSDEELRLKSNYEKKLTNNLKTNCKGFYSYSREPAASGRDFQNLHRQERRPSLQVHSHSLFLFSRQEPPLPHLLYSYHSSPLPLSFSFLLFLSLILLSSSVLPLPAFQISKILILAISLCVTPVSQIN